MKTLGVMILATIIGLIVMLILTIVVFILAGWFIQTFFPTRLRTGLGVSDPGVSLLVLFVIYFFNSLIASFITGFSIYRWGLKARSRIWQGFIGGFVIGIIPPTILYLAKSSDLIYFAGLALFSGVAGVIGYYVAGRKYRQRVS